MKRFLIIATCLLIIGGAGASTLKAENAGYIISGGVWTDDGFERAGGGFLTGVTFSLDESRGLYGRVLYHQFVVGAKPVQAVNVAAILKYDLGKNYSIYFNVGGEDYMGEDLGAAVVFGFGGYKVIWTGSTGENTILPWVIKLFGEADFANSDIETPDGEIFRLFFGLIFTPTVEK